LRDDVDIIVPCNAINSMGESIELSIPKDELETTLDGMLKEKAIEIQKQREAAIAHNKTRRDKVNPFHPAYTT
ncbi:MAG: hypothetical protein ACW98Y_00395, partial [Candidatus Thorarchaeota archaeon]